MTLTSPSAGAMPVAAGAMPAQSYPTGPVWEAYRLPYPSMIGAREAGVCFEGAPGDGATPPAAGTPPPTPPPGSPSPASPPPPPPPPAAPPAPPATGAPADPEGLGPAGLRALQAERDARAAAERELAALKAAGLSDQEKALAAAKRDATAEVSAKYDVKLIRADLRGRLKAAGVANDNLVELALRADAFNAAKLDPEGRVIDGDKLVEQFKKDAPEMFAPPKGGTATTGAQTGAPGQAKDLESAVAAHYSKP